MILSQSWTCRLSSLRCSSLKMEATKLRPQTGTPHNLSTHQRQALHGLQKNDELIIKKADKGSTIVILNKEDYIEKGLKHLSDHRTYRQLGHDTTMEVASRVVSTVRAMYQDGLIDKPTAEYLLPPNPARTQELYFLTKIHKTPHAERLIVSGCNGPTENISAYMDHWLQPIAQSLPSYIKDSKEFINFIESTPLPKDCLLCTLDVTSLYTNIPTDDGIQAVQEALCQTTSSNPSRPPVDHLIQLLDLVLRNNVFRFHETFYLQLQGTAMGTKVAPSYANIFMGQLESKTLSESVPTPIVT